MSKAGKTGMFRLAAVLQGVLLIGVLLRIFVFEVYRVDQVSMNNSYSDGDRVLILKLYGRLSRNDVVVFRRGGTAFIKRCIGLPSEVVGISGGTVFIDGKRIPFPPKALVPDALNMEEKERASASRMIMMDQYGKGWSLHDFGPYTVPYKGMRIALSGENLRLYKTVLRDPEEMGDKYDSQQAADTAYYTFQHDHYFLVGDNRPRSDDSRIFGPINSRYIVGKAVLSF
jgi:signal peptidase I